MQRKVRAQNRLDNGSLTILGATRRHYIPVLDAQSLVQKSVTTVAINVPGLAEKSVANAPTISQWLIQYAAIFHP